MNWRGPTLISKILLWLIVMGLLFTLVTLRTNRFSLHPGWMNAAVTSNDSTCPPPDRPTAIDGGPGCITAVSADGHSGGFPIDIPANAGAITNLSSLVWMGYVINFGLLIIVGIAYASLLVWLFGWAAAIAVAFIGWLIVGSFYPLP